MSTLKYCGILLTAFITLLLAVATINYVVNPYLMFEDALSYFDKKPEADSRVRTFKKYQGENGDYQTVIIGNSRVEMGLDPKSALFKYSPVYNAGVPGLSLQGQLAYGQNVIASNPIKQVFIAVDFVDFLSRPEKHEYSPYVFEQDLFSDYSASLLSLDALVSSFYTVVNQSQFASTRTKEGFNPGNDYIPILQYEGQDVLTSQKLKSLSEQLSAQAYDSDLQKSDAYSPLNNLLSKVSEYTEQGIAVTVFINPYQDLYYDALRKQNLFDGFATWKVDMESVLKNKVHYFDFTDLGLRHSSTLNKDNKLMYFWEPAHYKKGLGDVMLIEMTED